jgi:transcriptional regulator with XRE-family HTH domain
VSRWVQEERRLRRRLATNVRALRTEKGFSVETAAHDGEMHWRHWQKVEAGEVGVTLRTLAKLALALGVEPADLFRAR